ncbi:MAG: hypothetical protein QHG98_07250 [Methanothrix sp.]|jgi:hypothetical protein|nr:hypothetical protein [Methanothrix sp.]
METELLEIQFWGVVQSLPLIMWVARRHLPPGTELSIQPSRDTGAPPHYTIFARFPDGGCGIDALLSARDELRSLIQGRRFYVHLTTDFQPPVMGGWAEVESPYRDVADEPIRVYVAGHITERMPAESDVFAVHTRGETRNAAWFKLRDVVRELITNPPVPSFGGELRWSAI